MAFRKPASSNASFHSSTPAMKYGTHSGGVAGIDVPDPRVDRLDQLAAQPRRGVRRLQPVASDVALRSHALEVAGVVGHGRAEM
jgi:hypothetical protein